MKSSGGEINWGKKWRTEVMEGGETEERKRSRTKDTSR